MCLITFAFQQHPDYPLIVAANRDEFYQRPTAAAHFWDEQPSIYAGRDREAGGTWMGVNRQGRFAALTNYRQGDASTKSKASSRGQLCQQLLQHSDSTEQILKTIDQRAHQFSGFNLLAGNSQQLYYSSNQGVKTTALAPGIYGLSNGLIDSNWPKVAGSKQALAQLLTGKPSCEALLDIMADPVIADDKDLPRTGISLEMERLLSSRFIQSESYGTRCSTAILFHRNGDIEYTEQSFDSRGHTKGLIREIIEIS